jgi:hypothetical protein
MRDCFYTLLKSELAPSLKFKRIYVYLHVVHRRCLSDIFCIEHLILRAIHLLHVVSSLYKFVNKKIKTIMSEMYEHHLTTLLLTVPIIRYGAVPCNTATRQDLMLSMKTGIRNALAALNLELDLLGNPEVAEWRPNEPQAEVFVFFEQPWWHAEIICRLNLHGITINGQQVIFRISTRESKTLIDIEAFRYPDKYEYRACSNAAKYDRVRLPFARHAFPPSTSQQEWNVPRPGATRRRPTTFSIGIQTEFVDANFNLRGIAATSNAMAPRTSPKGLNGLNGLNELAAALPEEPQPPIPIYCGCSAA